MVARRRGRSFGAMASTALITGASRGLGLALARALAARGWRLVIDARGADALEAARAELAAHTDVDRARRRRRRRAPPPRARRRRRRPHRRARQQRQHPRPEPAAGAGRLPARRARARLRGQRARAAARSSSSRCPPCPTARGSSTSPPTPPSRPTRAGAATARRRRRSSSSRRARGRAPELRVYAVDPGDMRTQMHQDAFPGEDISDRPPPEESVPGAARAARGRPARAGATRDARR